MRHRVKLVDLAFIVFTLLVATDLVYEFDIFVADEAAPVANTIEADEWALLAALLSVCVLIFAWRRFREQKRETQRRISAEQQARELAMQDPLTGLPNRRQFQEALAETAVTPTRVGGVHALLMLDLNGFKQINDVYGHPAGDEALIVVSQRLLKSVRQGDLVARLGGDEFAILAQHLAGAEAATGIALRIAAELADTIPTARATHRVETGIGICLFPFADCRPDEIMRRADVALYKAKTEGRTCARFFDAEMDRFVRERERMERELRAAISAGVIYPAFQPLVDLSTNKIIGFEALARWEHPELGDIPPERFIPIAEDCGLISELSDQLLRRACKVAKDWPSDVTLAFNISPLQLKDQTLGLRILATLGEYELSPHRLELEITESALVRDLAAAKRTLGRLREAGVRIALDDFGTGYSSLYHLRNFKLDKIKIDRSFVAGMASERESAGIVSALIGLGQGLGFTVTAEGIEQSGQQSELIAKGCHQGQGFLYGEAMPAEQTKALFSSPALQNLSA